MRKRLASVITASAMVTAAALMFAPAAGAASAPSFAGRGTVHPAVEAPDASVVLYDQNNNDAGTGVTSQNFEASFDIYDNSGADDFVATGGGWKIKQVTVTGVYYNGYGPAVSETVSVYKDAGGLPGALIKAKTKVGADTAGSFVIKLGKTGIKTGGAGTRWLGVVVNMDFSAGGQWGWETRSVQSGNGAAWQNPGNGFGSGCVTWTNLMTCLGYGPDFMFKLKGVQL